MQQTNNSAHLSPYLQAMQQGYRSLRFPAELEQEFEQAYNQEHRRHLRWFGGIAVLLFLVFAVIDVLTLPTPVWQQTLLVRFGLVIPLLLLSIWASTRVRLLPHLQQIALAAALVGGVGTVAVIGLSLYASFVIPHEGVLLATVYIYFMSSLLWRRAMLAGGLTLLSFIITESIVQPDAQQQLYHFVFMLAANAIGASGAYFLEHNIRTAFLATALLRDQAQRDGLTGLHNRRSLDAHLNRVWRQAQREGKSLAIAMLDVDHFKPFNDHYGHLLGDQALRAVAATTSHWTRRPLDLAARYGGEEFVLLWFDCAEAEAQELAEQLRQAVSMLAIAHQYSEHGQLTISIGLAVGAPALHESELDGLRLADEALYEAKQCGRNRVAIRRIGLDMAIAGHAEAIKS